MTKDESARHGFITTEARFGDQNYQPLGIVLSRGNVVVEGDKFFGRAGQGQFLRRATYAQVNG